MARVLKFLFGLPLAALGVAMAVATLEAFKSPYYSSEATLSAFFAALCLLGAFFILRRN